MDYKEKIDYSSLSCYLECPRKFLFKYLMHFRGNANINLVFGSCYHYGLEVVYKELQKGTPLTVLEATNLSKQAFAKLWSIDGEPHWKDHDQIFPKSPGHATNMFHAFWTRYLKHDIIDKKVLAVEEPFSIILPDNLPSYIGRIDLIWEEINKKHISIVDHKTSKAIYPITLPGFEVSLQTDGYLCAGTMFYERIPSMTYSLHLCQKTKIDFKRYIINRRRANLDQFIHDLVFYLNQILVDLDLLEEDLHTCKDRNDLINSFRRRPGSACTTYMRPCSYKQICFIRNNPLLWMHHPPQGFTQNEWDPELAHEETQKKLAQLEKI